MSIAAVLIAQLTDLHLTSNEAGRAWGSPAWASFRQTLAYLAQRDPPIDRLVLTGDLVNWPCARTYHELARALRPWWDRLRAVPGNHDSRRMFRRVFTDRCTDTGGGRLGFADELGGCRLLGLDTHRRYRVHGRVGAAQRAWLAGELSRSSAPALLFMHHPPIRVGTWWLDKDRLRDAAALEQVLAGSRASALFAGHVHQEFAGWFAGLPMHTTPSTAYQFPPGARRPQAVRRGEPALRWIEWRDGTWTSEVERLPAVDAARPRPAE